ncbi:MAG: hypothetical protein QM757_34150 [Paludibaculum sp.]
MTSTRGLQVASDGHGDQLRPVVRANRAELIPISIGRDFGATVEVNSGLQPEDEVVLSPSDSLISGTPVRIAKAAQK